MASIDTYEEVQGKANGITPINRADTWKLLLEEYTTDTELPLCEKDSEVMLVKLDLPNQAVIKADSKRTRADAKAGKFPFKEYLEIMLTGYCKMHKLKYKQGLNELLAPFLLLKNEGSTSGLHVLLNMFARFLAFFVPTFYNDEEFLSLEYAIGMVHRLLRYHDPELAAFLFEHGVTPELYATSWLLTLFSQYLLGMFYPRSKHNINVVYRYWDFLIVSRISEFHLYSILALVLHNRNALMKTSPATLPQSITSLSIDSVEVMDRVLRLYNKVVSQTPRAYDIMLRTPRSFRQTLLGSCVYQKNMKKESVRTELEAAEKCRTMQIGLDEVMSTLVGELCPECALRPFAAAGTNSSGSVSDKLASKGLKTMFTRSSSFMAKTEKSKENIMSVKSPPARAHSKDRMPDPGLCKNCRAKIPKVTVIEIGKGPPKLGVKTRIDPTQAALDSAIKRAAEGVQLDSKIVLISDVSFEEAMKVTETMVSKHKLKHVGIYTSGIDPLLKRKIEFDSVSSTGTAETAELLKEKPAKNSPKEPPKSPLFQPTKLAPTLSPRPAPVAKEDSFMDKVTTMLGFAEKTISALSKQPMKLSFVASYSADEDHFNTAIKVTTKGAVSPQKTFYDTSAGTLKPRSGVPIRGSVSTNAGIRAGHVSSPSASPVKRRDLSATKQMQRSSKSITKKPPAGNALSGYMLENGIVGPLIIAKVDVDPAAVLQTRLEQAIASSFAQEYRVRRLPDKEEQVVCVLNCKKENEWIVAMLAVKKETLKAKPESGDRSPLRKTVGCEEKCVVMSRFYWKDLLKITSKTQDATILIFYFGLPETPCPSSCRLEDVVAQAKRPSPSEFASKHKNYKKVEVRYQFETVEKAKDCISCVKDTYKQLKQHIARK